MQTIIGSTGPIGTMLASNLTAFTQDIRLVSRNPVKVNPTDSLVNADLLNLSQTMNAVEGSAIVYFTAGLPLDTKIWLDQWPIIMSNIIEACVFHNAKLVFLDNTYMYPQTSEILTEETPFAPVGKKGDIRSSITHQLLNAMRTRHLEALICRAPEFYGPGKTKSYTNSLVFGPLLQKQPAKVPLNSQTKRSLIYTPDASRAIALLGNTSRTFGETWHLPCFENILTYDELIHLAAHIFDTKPEYKIISKWQFKVGALFSKNLKEMQELLPRYEQDNLFSSEKFKKAFPTFKTTSYEKGLSSMYIDYQNSSL